MNVTHLFFVSGVETKCIPVYHSHSDPVMAIQRFKYSGDCAVSDPGWPIGDMPLVELEVPYYRQVE